MDAQALYALFAALQEHALYAIATIVFAVQDVALYQVVIDAIAHHVYAAQVFVIHAAIYVTVLHVDAI